MIKRKAALIALLVGCFSGSGLSQEMACNLADARAISEKHFPSKLQTRRFTDEQRASIREKRNWTWEKEVPGLLAIYEAGRPYYFAGDQSEFFVTIAHDGQKLELISVFVLIVNIGRDEQEGVLRAAEEIVGVCIPQKSMPRDWLKGALSEQWDKIAEQMKNPDLRQESQTVQAVFGTTRVVIWGVPPDFWQILILPSPK